MKRSLLVAVFSVWMVCGAQTYSYHALPDSNVTWLGYEVYCAMGTCWPSGKSYSMQGDTTVNGIVYHKVVDSQNFFSAFIREDTSKRIFFIDGKDTAFQEKLVCDFSLSVGDTMFSAQYFFVVNNVDTLNYNGILRRTLSVKANQYLSGGDSDIWIEGIGSVASPIGIFKNCFCSRLVICKVNYDSTLLFNNQSAEYCDLLYNSINENGSDLALSLSPNPATTTLTLQLQQTPAQATVFQLFDITGRMVLQKPLTETTTRIELNGVSKGMYLYNVFTEGEKAGAGKLIIE